MWTTLALAAALGSAAGQTDQLTVTNVRATYGQLGPLRTDNKVLPGDRYDLAFDVEGIKVGDDGKVIYSMGMEVTNSQGKVIYGRDPRNLEAYYFLGGNRLFATTYVTAGFSQPPGKYTIKVSLTDRATKASTTLTREFELLPKDFGLVGLSLSYDPEGRWAAPPRGVTGQSLFVNLMATGFERDKNKKQQPDVSLEMRVLDENGKPTLSKPLAGDISRDVPMEVVYLPLNFVLELNRPGKFTVELVGTDRLSKKTAKLSFPVVVTEAKAANGSDQK
jgi:hypothetical protein